MCLPAHLSTAEAYEPAMGFGVSLGLPWPSGSGVGQRALRAMVAEATVADRACSLYGGRSLLARLPASGAAAEPTIWSQVQTRARRSSASRRWEVVSRWPVGRPRGIARVVRCTR